MKVEKKWKFIISCFSNNIAHTFLNKISAKIAIKSNKVSKEKTCTQKFNSMIH